MRTLLEARARGEARAGLAIDVFCYRLAKGLFGLCAALDRVDALVFTGGIGEHPAAIRAETLAQLRVLGRVVNPERNAAHGVDTAGGATDGRITADGSPLLSFVIPTNEELVFARETARLPPPRLRLVSFAARFLFLNRPTFSIGASTRAVIPLQRPSGEWWGYFVADGQMILGSIEVGFGRR